MIFELVKKILFYIPIFFGFLLLNIYNLSKPTVVTAVNPAFPLGGMGPLSKTKVYNYFNNNKNKEFFPKSCLIKPNLSFKEKKLLIKSFLKKNKFSYPLLLKPDIGQNSIGIIYVDSQEKLYENLKKIKVDYLIQKFYDYPIELTIFYVKLPNQKGKITGMSKKIFSDNKILISNLKNKYEDISNEVTSNIKKTFLEISDKKGFNYGRFDIKVKSYSNFKSKGKDFKILEVNPSADASPLHVYDKKNSLFKIYSETLNYWNWTIEIGKFNYKYKKSLWSFIIEHVKYSKLLRNTLKEK